MDLAVVGGGDADGEVGGGVGLFFQFSEHLVVGNGRGELFAKFDVAPGEEIFGPERHGTRGDLRAGLASGRDP
jgi:hypothetical protein